ncbi:MAG: sulfite exporter TauE/SafE family protein [Tenacibaculum sp.]|nr:sulfite exporter TauE/SafE family protein [Tenacibaculum sp.]
MTEYFLLIVVGIFGGFISTMAGGGSLLTLPMLIFLGLPPSIANGTNRIGIVIQTAMATAGFKSKKIPSSPFNIYIGISALIGSIIGAKIAIDIREETFNKILSVVMIAVLLIIIFKPKMEIKNIKEQVTGKYLWAGIIAFFFIGIYGGFINAGIGFVIIMFLHNVNKMTLVKSNATKAIVIFIYSFSALIVFILNDKVNWKMGLLLALGNAIGGWISSRFSVDKGEKFVKNFLIIIIVIIAIKLWFFDSNINSYLLNKLN